MSVHAVETLPNGTVAALDRSGSIELFSIDGVPQGGFPFPGWPLEMCRTDSALVVLGTLRGSDAPLHLTDFSGAAWKSIGSNEIPASDSPHRRLLVQGYLDGQIGCMDDRIIYARSSDGSVTALSQDGLVLWRAEIPSFVAMTHDDAGERGIRHAPPDGAEEVHAFHGIARFPTALVVQVARRDLETNEISVASFFLDPWTGKILGKTDSLPEVLAAAHDRVVVMTETPVPRLSVYGIVPHAPR